MTKASTCLRLLASVGIFASLAACGRHAAFTGIEHQNLNLEGSQVSWVPHTGLRGPNGVSFTHWQAPSVTETGILVKNEDGTMTWKPIETTQNPTPLSENHIHGPTNTVALGKRYTTTSTKPQY
jgi:hypothetical protein